MIKIKKQERLMIGILIVMIGITLYVIVGMSMGHGNENNNKGQIVEEQSRLSDVKKAEIEKYATQIVDKYPIQNHAMVVVETDLIANDRYKRYLVEVDTVAINQQVGEGLYTYYIVIQENNEGKFYMPPFGVEVLKNNIDPLKREIIISMMKVVNGWGDTAEEFEERWGKVLEDSGMIKSKSNKKDNKTNLETIYFIQSVLKYMSHYLNYYSEAIEYNDASYIERFLTEVPEFYEEQYKEIEGLENEGVKRKVLKAQITEVIPTANPKECIVNTQLDMRTYFGQSILDTTMLTKYKIEETEGKIKIINVLESKR